MILKGWWHAVQNEVIGTWRNMRQTILRQDEAAIAHSVTKGQLNWSYLVRGPINKFAPLPYNEKLYNNQNHNKYRSNTYISTTNYIQMIRFFFIWCQPICQQLLSNAGFSNTSHSWPPNKPCRWSRWGHKSGSERGMGWAKGVNGQPFERNSERYNWHPCYLTKKWWNCVFHGQRVFIQGNDLPPYKVESIVGFHHLSSSSYHRISMFYLASLPFPLFIRDDLV